MRRRLAFIARVLLVFLLGANALLAALPCLSADATAADAFVSMPDGCDEAPPSNLCLQHCIGSDQTSAYPQVPAFHAPAIPVLLLPVCNSILPAAAFLGEDTRARALGPPIPIRLQILLL
jgi:hypothetical protein